MGLTPHTHEPVWRMTLAHDSHLWQAHGKTAVVNMWDFSFYFCPSSPSSIHVSRFSRGSDLHILWGSMCQASRNRRSHLTLIQCLWTDYCFRDVKAIWFTDTLFWCVFVSLRFVWTVRRIWILLNRRVFTYSMCLFHACSSLMCQVVFCLSASNNDWEPSSCTICYPNPPEKCNDNLRWKAIWRLWSQKIHEWAA